MKALLISNLIFTVLFLVYITVFKRLTFFQLNRVYLLMALMLSAVLPWLDFGFMFAQQDFIPTVQLPLIRIVSESPAQIEPVVQSAYWIYWVGVIIGLMILSRALYSIWRLKRGASFEENKRYLVGEGNHAFSFFGRVQIGRMIDKEIREMIVDHEEIHRRQWHSLDVMLFACARVLSWFNPFVHWAAKEVQLNHEFLADASAYHKFGRDYQHSLLNQALDTQLFQLTNSFYSKSLIKNRILMMNKQKTGKRSLALYALIIPAVVLSVWITACSSEPGLTDAEQKTTLNEVMKPSGEKINEAKEVDVMPSFPGGQDALVAYFQEGFVYPQELKDAGVEGKVMVQFIVDRDGSLSDFESLEADDERLIEPAIEFMKGMPKWEPGMKDDQPVKVRMVMPLQYTMK